MKLIYAFLLFSIYTTRAKDLRQKSKYYIVETYDEFKDGPKEAIDNYEAKEDYSVTGVESASKCGKGKVWSPYLKRCVRSADYSVAPVEEMSCGKRKIWSQYRQRCVRIFG